MGACRYCGQNAGFLRKQHGACRDRHRAGIEEMVNLVAQSAGAATFSETALRQTLGAIAARAYAGDDDINAALATGWTRGISHAMADGILTRDEETRLREFRDRMALDGNSQTAQGEATLDRAATDRLTLDARLAALATAGGDAHLRDLSAAIRQAGLSAAQSRQLLIRAWEAAVEGSLEDGVFTLDEENALARYLNHFDLTPRDVNGNGAHTSLVQAAVIRDVANGIIPQRQQVEGNLPFNLMKSEQLVWVIDGVDYLETVTRRERRGTSHGVSIRVARGLYYRPSAFRSRAVEWEETQRLDCGLLGLTTKHIYFAGSRKRFRVRYDRIVTFEPYSDGLGIMRDAQTAKPQSFITGDGWFVYNLATNLAQL